MICCFLRDYFFKFLVPWRLNFRGHVIKEWILLLVFLLGSILVWWCRLPRFIIVSLIILTRSSSINFRIRISELLECAFSATSTGLRLNLFLTIRNLFTGSIWHHKISDSFRSWFLWRGSFRNLVDRLIRWFMRRCFFLSLVIWHK